MSQTTSIEWCDATWNPVRGCSRVSEGCRNCYAERQAARFADFGCYAHGFAKRTEAGPRWTGRVELIPKRLDEPLRWKKPRRIFVNSMSDLFHERLSDEAIAAVFGVMAACPQHTFQVLTKRPERARRWFAWAAEDAQEGGNQPLERCKAWALANLAAQHAATIRFPPTGTWPLPNVWLGVSVEDQATADERIPLLLQTPAALRFASYEPALGPVDFRGLIQRRCMLGHPFPFQCRRPDHDTRMIDWLIVGGESGPSARPFDLAWARSVLEQCRTAEVSAFVKQLGARPYFTHEHGASRSMNEIECNGAGAGVGGSCHHSIALRDPKGGDPSEWPEDLRVREFPKESR